jgi:ABC-type sugar transport system substrate-binding protein
MQIGLFLVQSKSQFQGKLRQEAEDVARRLGVALEVAFAEGDAVAQRKQLFAFMRREPKPDGFLVQPVETAGIRFVIQEAHQRGLSGAFINRHPAFLADFCAQSGALFFSVTPDNTAIGVIQGEQFRALLPSGGAVLYVTGPPSADSVTQRRSGAEQSKGASITLIPVAANWTQQGGEQAVTEWLNTTRGMVQFEMVGAQNDDMGVGARKALETLADGLKQPHLLTMPITGVDGIPEFGQKLVSERRLAATVVMPTTTGEALETLVKALRGGPKPELEIRLGVASYPSVNMLRA